MKLVIDQFDLGLNHSHCFGEQLDGLLHVIKEGSFLSSWRI